MFETKPGYNILYRDVAMTSVIATSSVICHCNAIHVQSLHFIVCSHAFNANTCLLTWSHLQDYVTLQFNSMRRKDASIGKPMPKIIRV